MSRKKKAYSKYGLSYDLQNNEVSASKQGVSHALLCRIRCFFENNFDMHS